MAVYSGFSHSKWWSSIAMLVYQRVTPQVDQSSTIHPLGPRWPKVDARILCQRLTKELVLVAQDINTQTAKATIGTSKKAVWLSEKNSF